MNDKHTYLADSVGELQAKLEQVELELELVKMNNARLEGTTQQQAKDVTRLRVALEDRTTECIQLRTLLEQMGVMLTMGLEKYRRQNMARGMTEQASPPPTPNGSTAPPAPRRSEPIPPPAPQDPPPLFLRRPGMVRTDIQDSRLPPLDVISPERRDADNLEELSGSIQSRRET